MLPRAPFRNYQAEVSAALTRTGIGGLERSEPLRIYAVYQLHHRILTGKDSWPARRSARLIIILGTINFSALARRTARFRCSVASCTYQENGIVREMKEEASGEDFL